MSVNKIVTKVDGVINKTINFNDLKAGISLGAHTITAEAWNGATLISTQTKNITITATTSYEAETTAYMNAIAIPDNSSASIYTGKTNNDIWVAVDTYIKDLKSNSLWDKIEALYPIVGDTANKHSYNLRDSNTYQITWFGSGTHTINGYTGNGTNGYGNTGFVETRNADNSSFVLLRTSNINSSTVEIGGVTASYSSGSHIYTKYNNANDIVVRNQNDTFDLLLGTAPNGWMATSRLNNTNYMIQKNDVSETFTRAGSSEICPFEYYVAARNKGGTAENFSSNESVAYGLGKGLTTAELSILRTLTLQLQINLGR